MEFISTKEAAESWGISQRRVDILCSEKRIPNIQMVGNMWIIPADAQKPVDGRKSRYIDCENDESRAKPFLKWAGGKGQLLGEIEKYYPFDSGCTKYAEPFVGGGAVLFDILNKSYNIEEVFISDVNYELINTYKTIQEHVDDLIEMLSVMQKQYNPKTKDERTIYYTDKRSRFNELILQHKESEKIEKAALMIFLNKTCFNGLYRVNKKGLFNVPMGAYKNPLICDEKNLLAVSKKLKSISIICGDYKASSDFIDAHTFAYFDPPYRPLNNTSSFTSYTEDDFNDNKQIELAKFVDTMSSKGAKIVVSNSDPKNSDANDNFFDEIYSSHNIRRVFATRMINSKSSSRGKINELLISNFKVLT